MRLSFQRRPLARHLRSIGVETRIEVVPSGIDVERFGLGKRDAALRKKLRVRSGQRMVLVVSRLAREKYRSRTRSTRAPRTNRTSSSSSRATGRRGRSWRRGRSSSASPMQSRSSASLRAIRSRIYMQAPTHVRLPQHERNARVGASRGVAAAGAYAIVADSPSNREVVGKAARVVATTPAAFAKAPYARFRPRQATPLPPGVRRRPGALPSDCSRRRLSSSIAACSRRTPKAIAASVWLDLRTYVRYTERMLQAHIGYAADAVGNGIAYARLTSRTGERLVRVAFRVQRFSAELEGARSWVRCGRGYRDATRRARHRVRAILHPRQEQLVTDMRANIVRCPRRSCCPMCALVVPLIG